MSDDPHNYLVKLDTKKIGHDMSLYSFNLGRRSLLNYNKMLVFMEPHMRRNPNIQVSFTPKIATDFFSQKKTLTNRGIRFFFELKRNDVFQNFIIDVFFEKGLTQRPTAKREGEIPLKNGEDKPGKKHPRKLTAGGYPKSRPWLWKR